MKKKAIQGIPYLKPQRAKKKYTHVAAVELKEIKGEGNLFVEVFRNTKEGRKTPQVRMVFTEKDWGVFFPESGTWSECSVKTDYEEVIWRKPIVDTKIETYINKSDEVFLWEWCGSKRWGWKTWVDCLQDHIERIRYRRVKRREDKKRARLEERIQNMPELPEELEKWAEEKLFQGTHFLYYRRHGRYATVCCSACGKVSDVAIKRREGYEGLFETVMDHPKNNLIGRCPSCGAVGTWKVQGKTKGVYGVTAPFFVGQKYKDGAVIRYLEAERIIRMEERLEEDKEIMTGASESISITEIARTFFLPGEKIQTDFHKYSGYSGKTFWDDRNLCGMNNIQIHEGIVHEKTWEELKGTMLQYSGAKEYAQAKEKMNLAEYMARYTEYPQMEMLTKRGLYKLVNRMIIGECGFIRESKASRPEDFLGIWKSRMKRLIESNGEGKTLEALQLERRQNAHWPDQILKIMEAIRPVPMALDLALRYQTIQKLINHLGKYAGVEISGIQELCPIAASRIRNVAGTYFDYIVMREERGYDLHNAVYLWPRDLRRAHDQMVDEINEGKIKSREEDVEKRFPEIRKKYRRLRNLFYYEDDDFLIRPARSAKEIVREGRILHHCVGGDGYLRKHNNGDSYILFLRWKESQEEPYITIEIKDRKIQQWYGEYDRKPDQNIIEPWLEKYLKHLERQEAERIRVIA